MIKSDALVINDDKSVPNCANDEPFVINDATDDIKSDAVSATIAPANAPTLFNKLSPSTSFIPVINGVTFDMKSDKLVPTSGKPEVAPAAYPPTILPTKLPSANPIVARSSPPSATISLSPGICANPPNTVNSAAIPAINAIKPIVPSIAPFNGILLIIFNDTDKAVISKDNAAALANVDAASICPKAYKITPNIPTINVNIPSVTNADVATFLQPLMVFNATANVPITNAIAPADAFTLSEGNAASTPNVTESIPIITAITIIVPVDFLMRLPAFSTIANIPITIDNAATGATSFSGLINDNAAIAVAIIAITTPIAIILPIHCFAFFVDRIIKVNISPRVPTASIPFAKPAKSIILSNIHTPAIIPIAADITNTLVPILANLLPLSIFETSKSNARNPKKPPTNNTPFPKSFKDNKPTSFTTPASNIIAKLIFNNVVPILDKLLPLSILDINNTNAKKPKNPAMNNPPLTISDGLNEPTIFTIIAIMNMAAESLSNIVPTLSIFLACLLPTSFPNASIIKVITPAMATKPQHPC